MQAGRGLIRLSSGCKVSPTTWIRSGLHYSASSLHPHPRHLMPASGFSHASGTKALCLSTLVMSTLVLSSSPSSPSSPLPFPRLLVHHLGFPRLAELALGLGLLYGFRHVERMMGSRSFLSYVTATTALTLALHWVAILVLHVHPAPGPFGAVFSLLVVYYAHVPAVPLSKENNAWAITQKMPVYVGSFLLAAAQGWPSLLSATLGLVAGLVAKPLLGKLVFPESVSVFFSRYVDSWFRSVDQPINLMQTPQRPRGGDTLIPPIFGNPPPAAAVNLPPVDAPLNENDVASLVALGFEHDAVRQALRRSRGDINEAANALFNLAG